MVGGVYSVEGTNGSGCTSESPSTNISVKSLVQNVSIIGTSTSVDIGQIYTYVVSQDTGLSYLWIAQNGAIVSGQGSNLVEVIWAQTSTGNLIVERDNGYCTATDSLAIQTTLHLIESRSFEDIYPNPTTGRININEDYDTIRIYSINTGVVYEGKNIGWFDLSAYSSGVYLITLTRKNQSLNYRVIKL